MLSQLRSGAQARINRTAHRVQLSRSRQAWLNAHGIRQLVCLGDSHIEPMIIVRDENLLPNTVIDVISVGGATASGIQNPNSRTNALLRFRPWLERLNGRLTVMACLGEVDAGYLVFTRPERPDEATSKAVRRYTDFLSRQVLQRGAALILVTVIPPIIKDYRTWAGPRGQTRDVNASWEDRAAATDQFNDQIRAWAADNGVVVFDLDPVVRDASTGRVLDQYRHPNPEDHHLDPRLHADLFARMLKSAGFS